MTNNNKIILTAAAALVLGLIAGKIIFGSNSSTRGEMATDHTKHEQAEVVDDLASEQQVWTCSMHPQVRQNEPGLCPICEMDLIPLQSGLPNDDPTVLNMTENAVRLAQIATTRVGGNSGIDNALMTETSVDGTVELDERLTKTQTSHVGGRIEQLYVSFTGDYVSKGQKIATIYSPELLTASKELITAEKYKDQISGVKEASVRKLKNWKVTDEQIAKILDTGEAIETIDIFADHSGYVLKKTVSQGDYIKQGGPMFTLGQTGTVWLFFNVFESDLPNVKIGQQVKFSTPSLQGTEFTARINYIDPLLDPVSRTARFRAVMNNPSSKLKPGMLLKGQVVSSRSSGQNGLFTVPKSAVLWTGKKSVVYVQLEDEPIPSFQYREVVLGRSLGQEYEILEGLAGNELVVTHGAFVIDASAQLNNKMSMMNKDVRIKKDEITKHPDYTKEAPEAFRDQVDEVMLHYLEIKNALVAGEPSVVSESQTRLKSSIAMVDMNLLKGDAHIYWMEQLEGLENHTNLIGNSENIEEQRRQFDFLSQTMINIIQAFGTNDETLFVQYCPMAFSNQGAEWISSEYKISNPYFGDKMLRCGSVLDSVTVYIEELQ